LYLVAALFLAMALLPWGFVKPVFLAVFLASALLLPFFGHPRLKPPAPTRIHPASPTPD
jgi:hypothetical protein